MILTCQTSTNNYDIVIERGALRRASTHFNLDRRVCIVTDSGVPAQYAQAIADQCTYAVIHTIPQGEQSKTLQNMERVCRVMLDHQFSRKDCVVAVGGGVVGDLSGFAASCYMRGVDFYNVPTTLLSQVDSSIGGKTAVDLDGVKNIVGAFHQPKAVIIDPDVLSTLPQRQIANGLAEAIKMSATSDADLFELMEKESIMDNIDTIIERSLCIKRDVVQQDEKENGLRKILNFGHTLGHGIETGGNLKDIYHGECVALGMLPFCDIAVRRRLEAVLKKAGLPTEVHYDRDVVWQAMLHDKKFSSGRATIIYVPQIGRFEIRDMSIDELQEIIL